MSHDPLSENAGAQIFNLVLPGLSDYGHPRRHHRLYANPSARATLRHVGPIRAEGPLCLCNKLTALSMTSPYRESRN